MNSIFKAVIASRKLLSLGLVAIAALMVPFAGAQSTFSNASSITIPSVGTATPYPSTIAVSGLSGTITNLTVTLSGLIHTWPSDVDVLLVGPNGEKFIVMSDAAGNSPGFAAPGRTYTLDDSASATIATGSVSGTYKPTNIGTGDAFVAPAPSAPYASPASAGSATFASEFNGHAPNGTWSLYVVDDAGGDLGSFSGGWSVTITSSGDPASTTSVVSSLNPSNPTDNVTFTSTSTVGGNPVAGGTITFKEGATVLAGPTAVNGSGQASFATNALSSGSHVITALYSGFAGNAQGGSGSVTQVVSAPVVTIGSSLNPSNVGDSVTFTGTATLNGNPVASGTITFLDGVTTISGPTNVDANGQVMFTTSALVTGAHSIKAVYNGLGTGEALIFQIVNGPGCNFAAIVINDNTTANPYPSNIVISGMGSSIANLKVSLLGFTHTFPSDVDVLLVGPTGQTVVLMQNAGGADDVTNINLLFDDAAANVLPTAGLTSGSWMPGIYGTATYPAPAPGPSYGATLAGFNGTNPNGTWSLYVIDDAGIDVGSFGQGWCLSITTSAEVVAPSDYAVTIGSEFSSHLASLLQGSDDQRVSIFNDDSTLVGQIEMYGTTTVLTPSAMDVTVEHSAARPGLSWTVDLYNFSISDFDSTLGGEELFTDTVTMISLGGSAADHVGGSGALTARITWAPVNDEDPSQDGWLQYVDQCSWTVTP